MEDVVTHKTYLRWPAFVLVLMLGASFAYAQEKYYLLGKEQMQFKLAADSYQEIKSRADWVEMYDTDGRRYEVKKTPLIDSSDIEGVSVDSYYSSKEEYTLTIYFKKESWDRIYNATRSAIDKKLAVIRNGKVFTVPLVRDAIDASTSISGGIDAAKLNIFLAGMTRTELPDKSTRGKVYLSWLEQRQVNNKNDLDLASKLANLYLNDGTKDYAKAAQLFEMVLKKDPSRTDNYMNLGICYAALGKTDRAIEMYTKAISVQPRSEWAFRSHMAELYFSKCDKPKAIEEMNKSISLLKKASMPSSEGAIKSLERRLNEMKK